MSKLRKREPRFLIALCHVGEIFLRIHSCVCTLSTSESEDWSDKVTSGRARQATEPRTAIPPWTGTGQPTLPADPRGLDSAWLVALLWPSLNHCVFVEARKLDSTPPPHTSISDAHTLRLSVRGGCRPREERIFSMSSLIGIARSGDECSFPLPARCPEIDFNVC